MTNTRALTGGRLWLRWSATSVVGIVIGFVLAAVAFIVTGLEEPTDPYFMILFPAILAMVGTILGLAQAWVLRRAVGGVPGWTVVTAVGTALGLAVAVTMPEGTGLAGRVALGAVHGFAIGMILGTLQWLVLRRRLPGARWWVLVSVVAWSIGAATGDLVVTLAEPPVDLLVGFAVAAMASGVGLAGLVGRSIIMDRGATLRVATE